MGVLELAVDQAHTFGGELDMGHRRLGRAGGHSQRRLTQDSEGLGGSDAADAMRLQDFGETGLVDLGGPGGGGRAFPQRQEVFRRQVVGQLQHLRVIANSATRAGGSGWPGGCAHGSGRSARECQESCVRGRFTPSRFDEPFVEHDSELGLGLAPFAWRHFPCLRDLAQDEIQQFDRRLIGWKMTSRSHGAPEFGVQGFDGVRNRYEDCRRRSPGCGRRACGVWCDHPGRRRREHESVGRPMYSMS